MEKITASKMQAVEIARGIVEASDEKLAFLLQLQEIVKSTTSPDDKFASSEDLEEEEPSPPSHFDCETAAEKDKDVALNLAADDLNNLVQETVETQLSLLEADRLAHLDAIQAHDAQFARSIADIPSEDWDETGDEVEDPFDVFHGPNELFACNEVDRQFDSVLSQYGDASSGLSKRSHAVRKNVMFKADQQHEKGKDKVVQEDDLDDLPASSLSRPSKRARSLENGDEDEQKDGDDERICQICFESPSPFVSVEGCGHEFCERCVKRHAEAKILDGALVCIPCPHIGCQTIISYTQLSSLLTSKTLEILSRRQIEAAIPESERVYCPFRDCSALLFKPSLQSPSSSAHPSAISVECEACHRLFCVQCHVAWHADVSCAEYQATVKNRGLLGDEKLLQLARKRKWQRCAKCGRFVELLQGCHHIRCLCGHCFCYICGASWIKKEKKPCICPMWEEAKL